MEVNIDMLRINYPYPDVRPNIDPRSVEQLRQKGGLRVSFALGYYDGKSEYWVSEGFWHIDPCETVSVLEGPLTQKYYYLLISGPDFWRPDERGWKVGVRTKCAWDLPTEKVELFTGYASNGRNYGSFKKRDALRPKLKYNLFKDMASSLTFGALCSDYSDAEMGLDYARFDPFTIGDYCLDDFTFEMKLIIDPYRCPPPELPRGHYHPPR
jgi:hypothetical protein